MKAALIDTGPLSALLDQRDRLHARARTEMERIDAELLVCLPVLTETAFLLASPPLRQRLLRAFESGLVRLENPSDSVATRALTWLERYAEHRPDFTDAFLVNWAEASGRPVWTFDSEFSTVWRTSKGRRVPLAVKS